MICLPAKRRSPLIVSATIAVLAALAAGGMWYGREFLERCDVELCDASGSDVAEIPGAPPASMEAAPKPRPLDRHLTATSSGTKVLAFPKRAAPQPRRYAPAAQVAVAENTRVQTTSHTAEVAVQAAVPARPWGGVLTESQRAAAAEPIPVDQTPEHEGFDASRQQLVTIPAATTPARTIVSIAPTVPSAKSAAPTLSFPQEANTTPVTVEESPSVVPLPAIVDSQVQVVSAPPMPAPVVPQQPTPPPYDAPPSAAPAVAAPEAAQAFPTSVPDPWAGLATAIPAYEPPDAAPITIDQVRYLALANNKDIAVLGYAPQIASTAIGEEAAVFDPVFNVNTQGGHYDRQTSTQINALGTGIPVLKTTFLNPGLGLNQAYVEKLFVTGGRVQAGIGQNLTSYSPTGDFVFVNPAWQSSLNVLVEQPLFRGRGRVATEARLQIARANQAQSWHSFQATVNQVLREAETAYWATYGAYRELGLRELALVQALQTVEREQERMRIGESAVPEVAQAVEHAEEFRIERADAENRYIAAQRELRRVMGVPAEDARSLVPITDAVDAPLVVDLVGGADQALARPELAAQRAAVAAAEAEYCRRRNGLQPDLALRGIYSVSGLDNQFDAAWSSLGSWNYNDWTAGVVYRQPLGRRADHSLAQRAMATLSMENARLSQMQHGIMHQLAAAAEAVQAAERMLELHRRRREAAAVQLEARRALYLEDKAELRDQLDAEERYAASVLDEASARVDYQRALTDWNFARGAMNQDALVLAQ